MGKGAVIFVSFLCRAEPFALRPLVVLLAFFAFDALAPYAFLASRPYTSSSSPSTPGTATRVSGPQSSATGL